MTLQEKIQADLKEAMKSGDELRRETLRMVLASVRNVEMSRGVKGPMTDADVQDVLRKENKKREDSMTMFQANGRPELAEKERAEGVFRNFLLQNQTSDVRKNNNPLKPSSFRCLSTRQDFERQNLVFGTMLARQMSI